MFLYPTAVHRMAPVRMSTAPMTSRTATSADLSWNLRVVAYGLLALAVLRLVPLVSWTNFHNDFSHYYLGGWMLASGLNPYTEPLEFHCDRLGISPDPTIPYAAHPPLILLLFSQLSNLSPPIAYGVWLIVQLACLLGFLEVTRRILDQRWDSHAWLLIAAVFANSICVQKLFYYSQVQILVGLMAYLALWAHLQRRHAWACGLITLAAAFKIYPVVLLPWFFLAGIRSSSDVARRTAAVLGMGSACMTLPGITTWIDFLVIGVPRLSDHAVKWTNYSVQNFIFLLGRTAPGESLAELFGDRTKLIAALASLALIGLTYLSLFVRRTDPRTAFCMLVIAAAVGGVIAWAHYLTLLFLPVALLWQNTAHRSKAGWYAPACIVGLLIWMPQLDFLVLESKGSVGRVLLHFYPLFAAVVASMGLLRVSRQSNPLPNATTLAPSA